MLVVCETIVNTLSRFTSLKKTISAKSAVKELSDEDRIHYRKLMSETYINLICALKEFDYISSYYVDDEIMTAKSLRYSITSRIREINTLGDVVTICDMILEPFQDMLEKQYFNKFDVYNYDGTFDRYYVYEYGNSLVADSVIVDLQKYMKYYRLINIFAIGSGCVEAAAQLVENNDLLKLYAFDPQKRITSRLRKKFTRVIYGSLYKSYITNEVFDMIIMTPPLPLSSTRQGNKPVDPIKTIIEKSFHYLRPGGILVFGLPYFRYYPSVCAELSKHYDILKTFTCVEAMSSHKQAYRQSPHP